MDNPETQATYWAHKERKQTNKQHNTEN